MSRKGLVVAMVAGAILASFATTGFTHTNDWRGCGGVVTSIPDLDPGTENEATVMYVDNQMPGSIWIYLETNNHPGLQRGGESAVLGPMDVDSCDSTHSSGPGRFPDQLIL
jgi:hypothetical protein